MDWKNNKRVQAAIGFAVVFLALRWLFSPTLQDAAIAYRSPPVASGDVADPITGLAMLWPLIDLAIAFLAGVGVWVLNLGDWLWSQVKSSESKSPVASVATVPNADRVQRDLIQAITMNDVAARMKLEPMVRGPQAISELTAAISEGDFAKAELKLSELKKLADQAGRSEASK